MHFYSPCWPDSMTLRLLLTGLVTLVGCVIIIIIIFITYTPGTNKHTHMRRIKNDLKHTQPNNNYLQLTEFTSY